VLRFVDPSITVPIRLDLIDFGSNGEGRRPLARALAMFDRTQAFPLHPAQSS
jgi:hypothetical protein